MSIQRVEKAINEVGGQLVVAAKLSELTGKPVGQSKISMWIFRGRVPPKWVIPLERALALLGGELERYDIRSDLYPRDHAA